MNNKILIYLIVFIIGAFSGAGGYYFLSDNSAAEAHEHDGQKKLYTCGMHPNIIEEEPGDCPICGMKLLPIKSNTTASSTTSSGEKKIMYYRAPMNPNEVYDEPGKSRMGMDLVPVYEDEGAASGVVTVDGAVMQSMNVKIEHVKLRDISSTIFTNGILFTDERVEYVVNTKVGGWIEKLYVNYTGQEVKKGEKLVEIYSPELVAAQQELLTAVSYEKAVSGSSDSEILNSGSDLVKNAIRKLELYDISKSDIEKLIETKNVTKLMTIYAPFAGTVLTKKVNEGEKINAGREITKIADLTNLWLKADIYESELNKIELGSTVETAFSYNPSKIYKGKISFIYPTVDPKTRTVQIRIDLKNRSGELKPAMFGNVEIFGKRFGMQPTVPETAVLRSGKKTLIMLALGVGRFKPVEVKLGLYSDGYYQILKGVQEGDMIVTSSQFMLDSESSLRSAVKLFTSSDAAEHENMDMSDGRVMESEVQETQNMNMEKSEDSKMDMDEHSGMDHQPSMVREGIIDLNAIDANGDGKVFQDLMDWNVISDEPGKCILCGMTLKEVTIDEAKNNLKENGFEYK
ncbi:MAG: efflux RND transporter periplasmic adaptor subunit [Melioribacteraceae bacterium]|nr:efflux RND transporter periplasmic adaptor subunit [Melioribacteraceae bacterium]